MNSNFGIFHCDAARFIRASKGTLRQTGVAYRTAVVAFCPQVMDRGVRRRADLKRGRIKEKGSHVLHIYIRIPG